MKSIGVNQRDARRVLPEVREWRDVVTAELADTDLPTGRTSLLDCRERKTYEVDHGSHNHEGH